MTQTIGMISLGCAKNQVNAEQMLYLLRQAGFEIVTQIEEADLVIINTCGFIESAKQEAIDAILSVGALKQQGWQGKILVTGCLSQRYQGEILKELPEADGVLGTGNYADIVDAVRRVLAGETVSLFGSINDARVDNVERVVTTPKHYAYLKIAEGCDNHCAYCVIPSLRGKFRSRPIEILVDEAKRLADSGVKELIVVAQDTSRYGLDLYGERRLAELLRRLCAIEGIHWVRVHYLYPDEMSDALIDVLAGEEKIVKYLDIPIQHVSDSILRAMNRRGTRAELEQLLLKLRERIPGLVLRTSVITGLPGEGETEFAELCKFLEDFRLERVGAFAFSPEEGTKAAQMDYPPEEIAQSRAEHISRIQARVMDEWNANRLGEVLEVLCDGEEDGAYVGRTYADSPEIDGVVRFRSDTKVQPGEFVQVLIEDSDSGDLVGLHVEVR